MFSISLYHIVILSMWYAYFCGIKAVFLSKNRITKPVDHFFTFCTPIVVVLHMSYRLCSYIIVQSFCYRVVLVHFIRKKEKRVRLEGERMLLKFIQHNRQEIRKQNNIILLCEYIQSRAQRRFRSISVIVRISILYFLFNHYSV